MQRKCNLSRLCFVLLLFANSINCLLKWDQNYCRTNKKHILCDQRDSTNIGISSSCKNITEVELTDNDKINFLTDVNKFRREIGQVGSPVQDTFPSSERKKSAVLMELEWSGELQKAARKVAEFLCEEIPTEPRLMEFEVTDGEGTFAYQSNYIQFIRYEISFKKEQFLEYQGGVRAFPFDTLQSYNNSLSDDVLAVLTYSKSKYIGCVGIKDWKGKEDTAYAVSEVCLLLPSVVPEHSDPFKPGEFCSNCSGGFNKCDSRTGMTFCIEGKSSSVLVTKLSAPIPQQSHEITDVDIGLAIFRKYWTPMPSALYTQHYIVTYNTYSHETGRANIPTKMSYIIFSNL